MGDHLSNGRYCNQPKAYDKLFIYFNSMSTRMGLFYAWRLGNCILMRFLHMVFKYIYIYIYIISINFVNRFFKFIIQKSAQSSAN